MTRRFACQELPENVALYGACRGVDTELFFSAWTEKLAQSICRGCPVMLECQSWILDLEAHLPLSDRWGVYGALTAAQRASLSRAKQRRTAA